MLARITRIERQLQSPGTLKRQVGQLLTRQTRRRLLEEKRSPDGKPWEPWTDKYAASRKPQHSLLIDSREMLNSIKSTVRGEDIVAVTSDTPYAAKQNRARPFLGVSPDNREEIDELVQSWLERAAR